MMYLKPNSRITSRWKIARPWTKSSDNRYRDRKINPRHKPRLNSRSQSELHEDWFPLFWKVAPCGEIGYSSAESYSSYRARVYNGWWLLNQYKPSWAIASQISYSRISIMQSYRGVVLNKNHDSTQFRFLLLVLRSNSYQFSIYLLCLWIQFKFKVHLQSLARAFLWISSYTSVKLQLNPAAMQDFLWFPHC